MIHTVHWPTCRDTVPVTIGPKYSSTQIVDNITCIFKTSQICLNKDLMQFYMYITFRMCDICFWNDMYVWKQWCKSIDRDQEQWILAVYTGILNWFKGKKSYRMVYIYIGENDVYLALVINRSTQTIDR